MATHQNSTSVVVSCAEDHNLSRECALKLVTGFLTDVSVMTDGPPIVQSGSMDWTTWQLLDSLFPTGGFAHSYGLETAYQGGLVSDCASLERFAVNSLQNSAGLSLPFVFAGNKFPNTECWLELNRILHAMLTNHVARKASLTQGSALLRTASTVFTEYPELKKMRACSYAPTATTPHHAPLFGVLCGLLGVDAVTAQRSYLFMGLRDILSAATRLNVTGPLEAAKLQHQIAGVTETLLTRLLTFFCLLGEMPRKSWCKLWCKRLASHTLFNTLAHTVRLL
ncbi:hypothetical protein Mapa_003376 [Marchantia paleacea]|nr:hypothetical protein Mapa_003376 [Marchantia paleacea]